MSLLRPQIQGKSYSMHRLFENFSLQFNFKKPQRKCNKGEKLWLEVTADESWYTVSNKEIEV